MLGVNLIIREHNAVLFTIGLYVDKQFQFRKHVSVRDN